jgi:hypothetical protein
MHVLCAFAVPMAMCHSCHPCSYEWAKRALSGSAEPTFPAHFAAGFAAEVKVTPTMS